MRRQGALKTERQIHYHNTTAALMTAPRQCGDPPGTHKGRLYKTGKLHL
jgi:hypothetical protein